MTTRIIVAGGREFNNYKLLKEKLDGIIDKYCDVEIVSGHAEGADKLGERYALERGLKLKVFPADWEKYGKKAGPIRNTWMIDYAFEENPALVVFWDGSTRGTYDTVKKASKKGIPTYIIYYPHDEYDGSFRLKDIYNSILSYPSFTFVSGRPGTGKTGFIFSLAYYSYISSKKKVQFFTTNMHTDEVISRTNKMALEGFRIEVIALSKAGHEKVSTLEEYIDIEDLPSAILIDSLEGFEVEAAEKMKYLSMKYKLPVIVTGSLLREVDMHPLKKPTMVDANNIGLGKMPDNVVFLKYPEIINGYGPEINLAKCKRGKTGIVPVNWNSNKLMYEEKTL